jgi:hypothetical protein
MYFVWGFTGAYTLHDPTPPGPNLKKLKKVHYFCHF